MLTEKAFPSNGLEKAFLCIITNTLPGIKISLNVTRLCRNGAQLAAQRQEKQEAYNGSACHDEA